VVLCLSERLIKTIPFIHRKQKYLELILHNLKFKIMPESVYKIVELVGSSTESWEKAAEKAIEKASKSLRDLRIAEVSKLDMHIHEGKIKYYRTKLKVSFKYED